MDEPRRLITGQRLRSQVCDTEVIVIRSGNSPVELACGGVEMVPHDQQIRNPHLADPEQMQGSQLGKRYTDLDTGELEVLVTRAGNGSLVANGARLVPKQAKPLPASD